MGMLLTVLALGAESLGCCWGCRHGGGELGGQGVCVWRLRVLPQPTLAGLHQGPHTLLSQAQDRLSGMMEDGHRTVP